MTKISLFKSKSKIILLVLIVLAIALMISVANSDRLAYADNEVYTIQPVITILTHGLGGEPSDWSNDSVFPTQEDIIEHPNNHFIFDNTIYHDTYYRYAHFIYKEDSLIEQLRNMYGENNALVYVVSPNGNNNPYIDKFTYSSTNSATHYSAESVALSNIDFSKHSIIVYNSENDFDDDTTTVYNRFKAQ